MAASAPLKALETESLKASLQDNSDSDPDSGQSSYEMDSPENVVGWTESMGTKADSDDEILGRRKSKGRKLLQESASDEEERSDCGRKSSSVEAESHSDENEKENIFVQKNRKPSRLLRVLEDSDQSDGDELSSKENFEAILTKSLLDEGKLDLDLQGDRPEYMQKFKKQLSDGKEKIKSKSKWSMKKKREEKKEKEQKVKDSGEAPPFNDSGCLLADNDLFENEIEEESLDAIRAAVKDKVKKQKNRNVVLEHVGYERTFDHEAEETQAMGERRKERKAAKVSREAIRHLHSETQRLVRESSLSLPYHLPEPKSIHEFFKRRPRPACQGSVMALLKSTKYQPGTTEESTEGADTQMAGIEEMKMPSPLSVLDVRTDEPFINNSLGETEDGNARNETEISGQNVLPEVSEMVNSDTFSLNSSDKMETKDLLQQEATEPQEPVLGYKEEDVTRPVHGGLVPQENRKSKLEKLLALGVDLSIKPRLCPDDSTFVNLDEPKENKDLEELKERFLKHSLPKTKPRSERKTSLSIVRKETNAEGKEELKAEVVSVTLASERTEENINIKPGEKLQMLKAKLQEAMKLRRIEERQKKQVLLQMDNEDGFEEEEEEEEMTDESEEEGESNQEPLELLLGEAEEEDHAEEDLEETDRESVNGKAAGKSDRCHSVPTPLPSESTLLLFKENSSKMGDSLTSEKTEFDETACKRDGKSEEEDSFLLPPLTKENSHNSSFELIGSMIPCYQPCNKQAGRGGYVLPTSGGFHSPPGLFKTSFISSASKSSGKLSEPSLPVEDSQDLYNHSPDPKNLFLETEESQFQFCLEDDTQSQLLDADGFLNVGHHRNKYQVPSKHRLILDSMDENAMDANMAELLDCCSGQFNVSHAPDSPARKKDMEELLHLCSGKFLSQADSSTQVSEPPKQQKNDDDLMTEAVALCSGSFPTDREEELGEFQLLPDESSDNEDEEDSGTEEDIDSADEENEASRSEDEEEAVLKQRQNRKRKLKLQDFLEDEAELSGSDAGSGDEYEGEDDEYEEEAIEEDLPSDEELQDQINKIHRKVLLDEDKRQLRLYQEQYLTDGDLHSDGPGRIRKFRWKNLEEASQMDMFHRDSDDDTELQNEEIDETEAKWRKERFEREQWLREQSQNGNMEADEEDVGEDSQFMKLAKKATAKALQKRAASVQEMKSDLIPKDPFHEFRAAAFQLKNGSLLNKPKEVLQKLAAMSELNPSAPRSSRNFVFQTLSPGKKEEPTVKPKPQVRKTILALTATPSPKRLRQEQPRNTKSMSRSIFPFLET
ncbi:LOW QUALITY PROTEIN: claspin [Rhinatrema bivittatum]|uniref:LOW QUALITY PROTEIN: claspin n=1 Tax=Rhinatrema bivittatum TaxID=194408 RepID=UPI0011263F89|nr:LOW QUALITY PROTEIN: claspin [Rhinatrema bivittatum]